MANRLIDNIDSRYFEAANALRGKSARRYGAQSFRERETLFRGDAAFEDEPDARQEVGAVEFRGRTCGA